jgi:putative addiction module CopG family antidote
MPKPLTTADLPEDLARFAEARIAAGLSANVEDALRAGAAALEAQQLRDAKRAKLRAAIDEGDRSPDAADGVFERIQERHGLAPPRR